ncbi:MAG: TIM-barrel domain-containing protein, partial [Chitinophagaceae bacterium]
MRGVLIIVCLWVHIPAGFSQTGLGSFQQVAVRAGKAEVITSKGRISFQLYQGGVVQTTFDAGYQNAEQISNAVVANPLPIIHLLTQNDSALVFEAGAIQITVLKQPVRIRYEKDNRVVQCVGADTADGHRLLQFSLNANEKIFGTGSRSIPLNRRGYRLDLDHRPWYGYNINAENLNYSMPFFVSSAHYGIFIDNPSRGYFDIGKSDPTLLTAGFNSGALQFYTFLGNSTGSVVEQFVKLVGTAPLPPRWALGNFMSRFGYRSQDEVMSIARKMQSADFPLDAVIIDLFWFGDGEHTRWNMGNLDWNRNRFPAPEKMMDSLRAMKLKTILITEPFVLSESNNYKETQIKKLNAVTKAGDTMRIKSFYFGDAGLLDIPKNETKDWFWKKYDAQIKKGIDGWWGDLGEPEQHPDDLYHNLTDLGFKRLFKASEVHNIYAHWWSEMLFDKYAKHYPSTRLFHLNRSGYAGSWRYGAIPWSGDVERSWAGLRAQLPIMIGMSLS